jgi:hypothetical protein
VGNCSKSGNALRKIYSTAETCQEHQSVPYVRSIAKEARVLDSVTIGRKTCGSVLLTLFAQGFILFFVSPPSNTHRRWARKLFSVLISCAAIDVLSSWPQDALVSVS